jgi:hypothetical protein
LGFVALLPQSHELRYYQFLPLAWAAIIAMLFPYFRKRFPWPALSLVVIFVISFAYMAHVNRHYYSIESRTYDEAAAEWNIPVRWGQMSPETTYCTVAMVPAGFMFTGPTMTEFRVVDRLDERQCPEGSVRLKNP